MDRTLVAYDAMALSIDDSFAAVVAPFISSLVGLALMGVGKIVAVSGPEDTKRLLDLYRRASTPRASVADGIEAKLTGVVVPKGPILAAPLTGRPCVIYSIAAEVWSGDGSETCELDGRSCEFFLDGDGFRANVVPKGATVLMTPEWLMDTMRVGHAVGARVIGRVTPEQRQWAVARLGRAAEFSYLIERILQPGEPLVAVGRLSGCNPGPPTLDASAAGASLSSRSPSHSFARRSR
jgi:hypothetical protein